LLLAVVALVGITVVVEAPVDYFIMRLLHMVEKQ